MLAPSVHDAIETAARLRPGAVAFLGSGVAVSYGQLVADVRRVGRFVLSQGLSAGQRAAIMMRPSYLHVLLILALDRLGVTSVSLGLEKDVLSLPGIQALKLDALFAGESAPPDAGLTWVEVDPEAAPAALPIDSGWVDAEVPTDRAPDRITRLVFSSGTTGTPKPVALSRDLVMKRIVAHHLYCEGTGSNRYVLGMAPSTIAGYGWLLMVLCRGAAAIPCLNGGAIVHFVDTFQASHLLLTPRLFHQAVDIGWRSGRDLASVRSTTTGGAPFDVSLAGRARAVLGNNIWNGYTSTEAGSVARGHIRQVLADPSMIGAVLPFATVEIVDDKDKPLPIGETGIVRVASELAVSGYEGVKDEDRVFRKGFVYPGDLGSLDARGYLRILGRVDEMINAKGVKTPPERIERSIRALDGVREAAVFQADLGQGLQVCAAVVVEGEVSADDLSQRIRDRLGLLAPQQVRIVPELPRNEMGKVVRRELAGQFAAARRKG